MNDVSELCNTVEVKSSVKCPVSSYTEWDQLEEVIVGVVSGAHFPPWHISLQPVLPNEQHAVFQNNMAKSFPPEQIDLANQELDEFVKILEREGVTVKRPEPMDHTQTFGAPGWSSTGLYNAMPRDLLLVIGDEIIECPLAWRSRYCEVFGYRPLLKEYFKKGAKWSSGPKPELNDKQYNNNWVEPEIDGPVEYVITEYEPTFDAADFVRCGRDLIVQKSHVTNMFGIEWLRRHLGEAYNIHILEFNDSHPMHIDATLMPLAPGKLLLNPERVQKVPEIFKGWDVFYAPQPCIPDDHTLYMTSKWINMNILMLDEKRVMVERQDERMINCLKNWGFKPILCNFRHFNSFGGSFHCATLDIRRRGKLASYLI